MDECYLGFSNKTYLEYEPGAAVLHFQGIENWGQSLVELYVNDGTDYGNNSAATLAGGSLGGQTPL